MKTNFNSYTVILDWMHDLALTAVELLIFAVIYGFSQDGETMFTGSRSYLARKSGAKSRRTVDGAIDNLVKRGLIIKDSYTMNGVPFARYAVNFETLEAAGVQYYGAPCSQPAPDQPAAAPQHRPTAKPQVDISALAEEICPSFQSAEWSEALATLACAPKWAKKGENAWRLALKKLASKPEKVAAEMVRRTVMGDWQGLFDLEPREEAAIMGTAPAYGGSSRPAQGRPSRAGVSASEEIVQAAMGVFNQLEGMEE